MSQVLIELERFLELSEAMASAAEEQEWESLVSIGEDRGQLLLRLPADFALTLPPVEHASARVIMERCQKLDDKTCSLMGERQKDLRVLLRELPLLN